MDTWLRSPGWLATVVLLLGGCAGGGSTSAPTEPMAAGAASQPATAPSAAVGAAPSAAVLAATGTPTLPPRPDRPVAQVTLGILDTSSDVVFNYPEEKGCYEHMKIEPVYER